MRQWTVDAFARAPFKGNPACVVEPFDARAAWPADAWMQALAAENNQAETAFLRRTDDDATLELRWFTPSVEVPLCGHATLAAAHVLFDELETRAERLTLRTRRSGALAVVRAPDGYVMDLPADPPRRTPAPPGLSAALGVEPREVWAGRFLLAVLEDEATVRALSPDTGAIRTIGAPGRARGDLIVAAPAAPGVGYDVVSRVFAPGSGIPEDPATGSAHCLLAPLFAERLGRARNRFHQAYPGRGGDLVCEALGARVRIEGQAITVIESRLRL